MIKTFKIQGQRTWEGPLDNYNAHPKEVEHWCAGGEVEYCITGDVWSPHMNEPANFHDNVKYRIKQREPKSGEVWVIDDIPYLMHELHDDHQSLDGWNYCNNGNSKLQYSAPSVEAYYARKFQATAEEIYNSAPSDSQIGVSYIAAAVNEAAQLEDK